MAASERTPEVVIVGGGFGGLSAAQALNRVPVNVTLIDRRNFHLFQPLLYQVATGGLSPANIAAPLRAVLKRQANARVVMAEVIGLDLSGKRVAFRDGDALSYDYLIVAAGARHHYFGHPEWETDAPGLKTIEDATEIRRRVLSAFEQAERTTDEGARRRLLTFAIVGGGPTGLELAGAISDLARHTLRRNYRRIDPSSARILLVEGADRVLPPFVPKLSASAERALSNLGVEVWTKSVVTAVSPDAVTVKRATGIETVPTATVLWAAGVQASPLCKTLAEQTGAELDRAGRIAVGSDLTLPGRPEVFAIGDQAWAKKADGTPLPGLCPVAMQQGQYVAATIHKRMRGEQPQPFRYRDKGTMATIGRATAVVDAFGFRFGGYFAWLTWLFVHLMFLIAFENRILVMMQWFWNYVTRNRSARLITGTDRPPAKS